MRTVWDQCDLLADSASIILAIESFPEPLQKRVFAELVRVLFDIDANDLKTRR